MVERSTVAISGMSSCVTLLSNAICKPTNAIYKQTQRTRCDRGKLKLNASIA